MRHDYVRHKSLIAEHLNYMNVLLLYLNFKKFKKFASKSFD